MSDTVNSLVKKFEDIKSRKEKLEKEVTQKEASFNTLKEQYKQQLTEFCKQYKVKSLDEAAQLLAKEEKELQVLIDNASDTLKVFNTESTSQFPDLDL